jgi:hypothetical protein
MLPDTGSFRAGARRHLLDYALLQPEQAPHPVEHAATTARRDPVAQQRLYHLLYMATEKLTVTVRAGSIRKLDRWVREGRYANRSRATQAALDLLERRNALPTLGWALAHPRPLARADRHAWRAELRAIDAALDAVEPPSPARG